MRLKGKMKFLRGGAFFLFAVGLACVWGCRQNPAPETEPRQDAREAHSANAGRAAGRYDLERDEQRGGHTLTRHVTRTDTQLEERLERERNISAASTWTDRETAEAVVAEALRTERDRIQNWVWRGYPRPNLALRYDAGQVIGRSLRRGASEAVPCRSAVIVLRADGRVGFYVLTAYPEARE